MSTFDKIYQKLEAHKFDETCCFLCGEDLNDKSKTQEHVIPKWIQRKFNLWDKTINLLNNTDFRYRNLTIPCCLECNNKYLKPIEDIVINAIDNGVDSVRQLDKDLLFYWLGKIYFGLMYKELFLSFNQESPDSEKILTPEYIKDYKAHHLFLQGVRGLHRFNNFVPYSIYIVETQTPNSIEQQWDYYDSHNSMVIACRVGKVGFVCVLQDGGASQYLEEHLNEYFAVPLHPLQFRELVAKIIYKSMLLNRTPKFLSYEKCGKIETMMMPLGGLSGKPLYDDWDNDFYGRILSEITNVPVELTNPEPGKVRTWMINDKGEPIYIDVNEQ